MRILSTLALCLVLHTVAWRAFASDLAPEDISTNIVELISSPSAGCNAPRPFKLTGVLLDNLISPAFFCDGHAVVLFDLENLHVNPQAGDSVTVEGLYCNGSFSCTSATINGKARLPRPLRTTPLSIQQGHCANRFITTRGLVTDVFKDDIDAGFIYLLLTQDDATACVAVSTRYDASVRINDILCAEISVSGLCQPPITFQRPYSGCIVRVPGVSWITIERPAVTDPLAFPELSIPPYAAPQEISSIGKRHVCGTVIAVSDDGTFMLREKNGRLHNITPASGQGLPRYNDIVVAGGSVQTDFYLVNLARAIYRITGHSDEPLQAATDTAATAILFNERHERQAMPRFYGQAIRLTGTVTKPNSSLRRYGSLFLDCDSVIVPVNVLATGIDPADFPVGAVVSASGICLMNVENWSPTMPFSRIDGFSLVARTAEDIRLLKSPPWWTPARITAAVSILLVLLVGIGLWNVMLNRLVRRRTLVLVRAKIARDRSDLKTDERTRLAVELHDSLSQNLSGLGCQLIATRQALQEDPKDAERRLGTAETMLASMRTELKRCLFDLRNDALEERDFEKAILHTLAPVAGIAKISLRFVVPRSQMNDSQAHTVLSIVRELTANAIVHGKAANVRIAGCLDAGKIVFSVQDDGTGFNPTLCNGPLQGHFGLSGVRTRVKKMNGTLKIDSWPGKGTYVKATLRI